MAQDWRHASRPALQVGARVVGWPRNDLHAYGYRSDTGYADCPAQSARDSGRSARVRGRSMPRRKLIRSRRHMTGSHRWSQFQISLGPRAAFFLKILLDERDRHAALSHGGGHSLDWAQTDVAAREYTRYARFKEIGIAVMRPAAAFHRVIPGWDVSAIVPRDLRGEPFGFRVGTDEDKQSAAVLERGFLSVAVQYVHSRQVYVAPNSDDLRVEPIGDV